MTLIIARFFTPHRFLVYNELHQYIRWKLEWWANHKFNRRPLFSDSIYFWIYIFTTTYCESYWLFIKITQLFKYYDMADFENFSSFSFIFFCGIFFSPPRYKHSLIRSHFYIAQIFYSSNSLKLPSLSNFQIKNNFKEARISGSARK